MYNEELFQKLSEEFDTPTMKLYCVMTSKMYNYLYENCSKDVCNEYDYQRQWWLDKSKELSKILYNLS